MIPGRRQTGSLYLRSTATLRCVVCLLVPVLALGVLACGSDEGGALPTPATPSRTAFPAGPTPVETANLTAEQAIDAALASANHIIQNALPQGVAARYTTLAEALESEQLTMPLVSPFAPSGDTLVWVVKLTGMFYEPSGPPVLDTTATPLRPMCSVVTVLVRDGSGDYIMLTVGPADVCDGAGARPLDSVPAL